MPMSWTNVNVFKKEPNSVSLILHLFFNIIYECPLFFAIHDAILIIISEIKKYLKYICFVFILCYICFMGLKELQEIRANRDTPREKKKYVIPKISKKRQKKLEEQKDMIKLDEVFYKEVWAASAHVCQNCDCKLPKT